MLLLCCKFSAGKENLVEPIKAPENKSSKKSTIFWGVSRTVFSLVHSIGNTCRILFRVDEAPKLIWVSINRFFCLFNVLLISFINRFLTKLLTTESGYSHAHFCFSVVEA